MIHVVSTGLNAPTKRKCVASVQSQVGVEFVHTYVEAAEQPIRRSALENFHSVVSKLHPLDVVAWVDGDDELARPDALKIVADVFRDPEVWLSYGSFRFADGRSGFAEPYTNENFRGSDWKATHLKCFRAGLFQKLGDAELKRDGAWRDLAIDMAVMFPALELAGLRHSRHVREILYAYHYETSFEHNATPEERAREVAMNKEIRALPRRERLASL